MKKRILCGAAAIVSLFILFMIVWPLGGLLMPQRTSFRGELGRISAG